MRKKQGFISRFRNQFQSLGCSIYQLKFILCNWNHGETTRPRTYENLSTVKAARRNLDTSHQQSSSFSFTRRYFQSSWSNSSSLWSVMEMGVAELPNSKNCLRTRGKFSHAQYFRTFTDRQSSWGIVRSVQTISIANNPYSEQIRSVRLIITSGHCVLWFIPSIWLIDTDRIYSSLW